jgi:peptide/nickel transport system substrate-binding protein
MPPDYDIDLAKSLLAQAGYPDGITIELHTSTTGGGAMVPLATVMKEKAAPAGINIEIVQVPETGYWSDAWMVKPFVTVWWGGRPAYEAFSVVYPTGSTWNESKYSNLELDSLLETAMGQGDLVDQMPTYAQLQCIVVDEVPRIIPVFRPVLLGARLDVRDLVPMPDFSFQARWAWLDR